MGIPRLQQTLQPFAEQAILGRSIKSATCTVTENNDVLRTVPSAPTVTSIVIDGPALVYHVYHRLLSCKSSLKSFSSTTPLLQNKVSKLSPFTQQPSYTEINQAVLSFITYLHNHQGVEVQKIYFDGGLPVSKRNVRLLRLEDGRKRLVEFRRLNPNVCWDGGRQGSVKEAFPAETLFETAAPALATLKAMPVPPFMVPAVIEYLRTHLELAAIPGESIANLPKVRAKHGQYSIVEVVPGEADVYCAAYAAWTGSAVLTSDSDLLAYDLGMKGSAIFLNSLESTPSFRDGDLQVVQCTRYHGPSLAKRLGIPHDCLQRFCFERYRDPMISTGGLKLHCGKPLPLGSNREQDYWDFLTLYSTTNVLLGWGNEATGSTISQIKPSSSKVNFLPGLDPRLAELVVQLRSPPLSDDEKEVAVAVYLPVLLEDPDRDSAWIYGKEIRKLAYSLLMYSIFDTPSRKRDTAHQRPLKEYQRRGIRIIDVPTAFIEVVGEVDRRVDELLQLIWEERNRICDAQSTQLDSRFWKSFGFAELVRQRNQDGKATPSTTWLTSYLSPHQRPYVPKSWYDIHMQASLSSVLYSLRMLKQAACLAINLSTAGSTIASTRLVNTLQTLPSIPCLMVAEEAGSGWLRQASNENGVGDIDVVPKADRENEDNLEKSTVAPSEKPWIKPKRKKKHRSNDKKSALRPAQKQALSGHSNSMFAALAPDD